VLVSPPQEVAVVEAEVVLAIRALADCGVGSVRVGEAEDLTHVGCEFNPASQSRQTRLPKVRAKERA
jgi:hypothetical protein